MKKIPYIIMAPAYRHNSAGIRVLYKLRDLLIERGYEAGIFQVGKAPVDSIVVYPEVVSGNPFEGETVARYVLNFPGYLGGDKEYDSKELVFTYASTFYPGAPVLTIPAIEDFFRDEGRARSGGCFWVGKGYELPRIPETEGLTEITAEWPATREELAALLNAKEVFYSYDNNTALLKEAELCGCKVVVIPDKLADNYNQSAADYEAQLDEFIRITQRAAREKSFSFGCMVNDWVRLDMVLKRSSIQGNLHYIYQPDSAAKGLNKLLDIIEAEGAGIAVLTHQDMFYRRGWIDQVKAQLAKLPDNWIVAGIIGKDMQGRICGRFHDTRIPPIIDTSDVHDFPHPASCFDECCIIVNTKSGFRFNEELTGFDLYGTMAVLQAWEKGGTAWVLDAFAEHYCLRPFTWRPDEMFVSSFKMLWEKYHHLGRVDTTAIGFKDEEQVAA